MGHAYTGQWWIWGRAAGTVKRRPYDTVTNEEGDEVRGGHLSPGFSRNLSNAHVHETRVIGALVGAGSAGAAAHIPALVVRIHEEIRAEGKSLEDTVARQG